MMVTIEDSLEGYGITGGVIEVLRMWCCHTKETLEDKAMSEVCKEEAP